MSLIYFRVGFFHFFFFPLVEHQAFLQLFKSFLEYNISQSVVLKLDIQKEIT